MTDADTFTIAFFRQEFQIHQYEARVLLGLYKARRPATYAELAERTDIRSIPQAIFQLRKALGDEYIAPTKYEAVHNARYPPARYSLTDHGRHEIDRLLRSAVLGLAKDLGMVIDNHGIVTKLVA